MVEFARGEHYLQHNVARLENEALCKDHLGTRRAADKLQLSKAMRVRLGAIGKGVGVGNNVSLDIVLVDK